MFKAALKNAKNKVSQKDKELSCCIASATEAHHSIQQKMTKAAVSPEGLFLTCMVGYFSTRPSDYPNALHDSQDRLCEVLTLVEIFDQLLGDPGDEVL
ncbi:MAG: hypothetical protein IPM37_16340 [Hahellaceae bacterium]|jgi:hypothetical protein|nr:hypothetical protein [Hahellaceae bacterium]